ncbi:histidine ammonia-lyase [Parapedobacter defluvii]|uniref:Histidine ammonia-lyase n=1 Tax=Parapedobacter defluvii TaxID=2045106 RepID=A0ABQ1L5Z0_9SPHI|nr:histidine ammonia-lyase [Parapedobacter defluvii]RQP11313.1 MAG: histidine ammonia-lyase [Parapedobacter sp.]GGC19449.1 histidine ammonia-lyase [Parapedobacter defluvii]
MKNFRYGTDKLTIGSVIGLTRGLLQGTLSAKSRHKVDQSEAFVKSMVSHNDVVYGINTGFGPLCDTIISAEDTPQLQYNLLQSHAVGVGNPIPASVAKTMMIIKAQALAQGYSGVQLRTLERIIWMAEQDLIPVVPSRGSVGASGDLAPLSHLFLPLIGLGNVYYKGGIIPADVALKAYGMSPLQLGPKEGLALINGTQFIAAYAVHALHRMYNALEVADLIGAMSLEGLMGSYKPFDSRLHEIRPFPGNQLVAHRLWELLHTSEIANSHPDCGRVQDPYSLRCMPQVHGASRTAWLHLKELTEIEINAVTDNPIVLGPHEAISGGNFHGQPLALAIDYATVGAAELGNISDRRSYLIIEGRYGLPKLLIPNAGLHSGFMVPQYTSAALVSENKTLCFPASADSIPTSLGQEDHVSMGAIGARKLNSVLDNLEYILAIELLYAAQALEFRRPLRSSAVLEACHTLVRTEVPFADRDRIFADDIEKLQHLIHSGKLLETANQAAKTSHCPLNKSAYDAFRI